jgi:hypothetical protein
MAGVAKMLALSIRASGRFRSTSAVRMTARCVGRAAEIGRTEPDDAIDGFTFLFEFGELTKRRHAFLVDLPDNITPAASNEISRCGWIRPRRVSTLVTSVSTREIVRLLTNANAPAAV